MCEFETPFFVYYTHITVFVLSLVLGIVILLKGGKHPFYRNAFYFILVIALWMLDDLVQWTAHTDSINLIFARISIWGDLIFLFFLYFVHYFTYTEISVEKKLLLAIPYILPIPFIFSQYNIQFFDVADCEYVHHRLMYLYLYFFEILYAAWASYLLFKFYRNPIAPKEAKIQARILAISIWFFAIWMIVYEEIGRIGFLNGNYIDITPHFVMGNLFFVSVVAFFCLC